MSNSEAKSNQIGFFGLLGILFIGLKLTGHIDWPWWVVLAPIWGPLAFMIAIVLAVWVVSNWARWMHRLKNRI